MATKTSFRARTVDAAKPLPVYRSSEVAGLLDAPMPQSRGVSTVATGMEKEEEEVRTVARVEGAAARD